MEPVWDLKPGFPLSLTRIENDRLGTAHTVVGYLFAMHWKLPERICTALYLHHTNNLVAIEDNHERGLVAILKIADSMTDSIFEGTGAASMENKQSTSAARAELMLDRDLIGELEKEVDLTED